MKKCLAMLWILTGLGCSNEVLESHFFDPDNFGELTVAEEAGFSTPAQLESCEPIEIRACAYSCRISPQSGETDCDFMETTRKGILDMAGYERLTILATFENPDGFSFHLGDSPSNNGYGGDGAEFSNDAELFTRNDDLFFYGSDHSLDSPNHVREFPGFLSQNDGQLEFTVADGEFALRVDDDQCLVERSDDLLRVNAPDREGAPDPLWYLGIGGVYSGGRTGTGLKSVELCFQ